MNGMPNSREDRVILNQGLRIFTLLTTDTYAAADSQKNSAIG